MQVFERLPFKAKIWLAPALALALFAAAALFCVAMVQAQKARIEVELAGQFNTLQTLEEGARRAAEGHSALYRAVSAIRVNAKAELVERALAHHRARLEEARAALAGRLEPESFDADARPLYAAVLGALERYLKAAAAAVDRIEVDINLADASMSGADDAFLELGKQLGALGERQQAQVEALRKSVVLEQNRLLWLIAAALAAALALGAGAAAFAQRAVLAQLDRLVAAMRRCADGDLGVEIANKGRDQIGQLYGALARMRDSLRAQLESARASAAENLRIRQALDSSSSATMLADREGRILYLNRAQTEMFEKAKEDLRRLWSDFDPKAVVGKNIDMFHRDPARVRQILAGLTGVHRTTIPMGSRTFTTSVEPIVGPDGERIGYAASWVDRSAEVAIEKEVAEVVAAAAAGDFSRRLALEGKEGFFRQLAEAINRLLDTATRGLEDIAGVLAAFARGDLTERMRGEYQGMFGRLAQDANATAEALSRMVQEIKGAAEAVDVAAREIAAGNADLSSRTEEQASSLEETAASMEELTGTVKSNAENARQANQLAVGASEVATKGGSVVREVVATMRGISDASKKIADIIGVIDGIAFQTNLLALNAAVEAARAGEQGRGFAVVAAEVRGLAQRSAAAAKEIKALIEDSVGRIEAGGRLVDEAGRTMEEIVASVKRVTDIMGEIQAASQEQSAGIEQVNKAVSQMDQTTQQNAALVEEATAAAESLKEQAAKLVQAVANFRIEQAEGAAAAPAVPAAPARERSWDGRTERRSANRPRNVARLPLAKRSAEPPRAGDSQRKAAGAEEGWEEF